MAAKKPDAVALLKADRRKVEDLFEKFKQGESLDDEALVQEICTELTIHSMLEEELLDSNVRPVGLEVIEPEAQKDIGL